MSRPKIGLMCKPILGRDKLPILKEYVEKVLGKKMTIVIEGNEKIIGGEDLKEYLKLQG